MLNWLLQDWAACPKKKFHLQNVYDSATKYTTHRNKEEIVALLPTTSDTIALKYMNVQHQYIVDLIVVYLL